NTPAERMPQLSRELVKARAARLRHAAADRRSRWLDSLAVSAMRVLIENNGKGHSDTFAPVEIAGASRGQTGLARVTGRNGDRLMAEWA
ncbi:MAG: tRNA (N(6)-L-threonylcarbamoyladenosine(37)-C(2))-methylthiotransferase MtaB, partial [Sphingomicrobium sp.]